MPHLLGLPVGVLHDIPQHRAVEFRYVLCWDIKAFNQIYAERARLAKDYEAIIAALTDTADLDKKAFALTEECEALSALAAKYIDENAHTAQNQEAYQERFNGLLARHEAAKKKLAAIAEERMERKSKREAILRFLADLEQAGPLAEFDKELWFATVETVTLGTREAVFHWRDARGTAIPLISDEYGPRN